jgi:hypothetical protein
VIDDIDIYGTFVAPPEHYFGMTRLEHVVRCGVEGKYDFCLYELQKFFRLLLKSNPNVLSLLWLPENSYVICDGWGTELLANRHIFLSKVMHKTFGGYAYAQLQKMTQMCTKQAYQGAKRRERFEKFGYDCKNASHLVRLLRMGIEALTTGELIVGRPDAAELKAIKRGEWTLRQVRAEATRLSGLLDDAFVKSSLPPRPDFNKAEQLLMSILQTTQGVHQWLTRQTYAQ